MILRKIKNVDETIIITIVIAISNLMATVTLNQWTVKGMQVNEPCLSCSEG